MTRACIFFALTTILTLTAPARGQTPPNPYGIAGYGVLDDLNMPADCLHYDWNGLHTENPIQMCRPNHYYDFVGIPHRWWGWNEQTGEINDPAQFDQWVLANPGKIWIIGNEPDLQSQDGLTQEQYALMYKTYHDFISQRDPTARFCIGAITGGSATAQLTYTQNWYQTVLDYYETTYGEPMPIDIWNIHSYCGPKQIENPDQPIQDFVQPFVQWCHTVENGRYADAEVWITELPIGEWLGALSEEWIIWFAERYLPRLEQAGIDRWFWFVSRDGGEWATVALVKSYGVSPLGTAYADLAHGYPNAIPPVPPYVPDPTPDFFHETFSAGTIEHPWMIKAGQWTIDNGTLRQTRQNYAWNGETCVLQYAYGDFDATFRMRVNDAPTPDQWAGFLFHATNRFHWHADSGYLVYMRENGNVGLFSASEGSLLQITGAVEDASQWHDMRVQMDGWRIRVWVDRNLIINLTDAAQSYAQGYSMLQVLKTDGSYDDLRMWTTPGTPPAITDTTISRRWWTADDATPISVTTSAEDVDGLAEIVEMRVGLDDGSHASDHARGQLAWGLTDEDITSGGGDWTLMGDATGGGRWAWRVNAWGSDDFITPVSASTSVQGETRSVTFSFTVKPVWAPAIGQTVRGYARDLRGSDSTWIVGPNDIDVHPWHPGDMDGDGDADQSDFGRFQACLSGSGVSQSDATCLDARFDADDDVDSADFGDFLACLSGAGIPADPSCAD